MNMVLRVTHMLSKEKMKETLLFFGMSMVTIFGLSILITKQISADLNLDTLFSFAVLVFTSVLGNMLVIIFQLMMVELGRILPAIGNWLVKSTSKHHIYNHHIYNNEYKEKPLEKVCRISSNNVKKAMPVDKTETNTSEPACMDSSTKSLQHEELTAESHETDKQEQSMSGKNIKEAIQKPLHSTTAIQHFPFFSCEEYSKRYMEAEWQRERRKAERQKAISEYIINTMSPYVAPDELAALHDEITAWMHDPTHKPRPMNLRDKSLTTMDLRHFIWNIAERLDDSRNYNGKNRARFTKALFPKIFADTEIDSIRNFTVNPNSGIIHIDKPEKGSFLFHYDDNEIYLTN